MSVPRVWLWCRRSVERTLISAGAAACHVQLDSLADVDATAESWSPCRHGKGEPSPTELRPCISAAPHVVVRKSSEEPTGDDGEHRSLL
jgi:hypothetical protein